jgi:hypothetical protein
MNRAIYDHFLVMLSTCCFENFSAARSPRGPSLLLTNNATFYFLGHTTFLLKLVAEELQITFLKKLLQIRHSHKI